MFDQMVGWKSRGKGNSSLWKTIELHKNVQDRVQMDTVATQRIRGWRSGTIMKSKHTVNQLIVHI